MVLVLSHPSLPQTTYQTALQMDMASSSRPRATGFRPSSSWSPQEDQTLIEARARGLNWGPIAENYFPGKTANACRKRHERLAEHRHNENWDALRLEALARTYQEVREEMWSILASRLNEKWNVVEQKVPFSDSGVVPNNELTRAVHGEGGQEPECYSPISKQTPRGRPF